MFTNNGMQYLYTSLANWGNLTVVGYDGNSTNMTVYDSSHSMYPFRPGDTSGTNAYTASMLALSNNSLIFYNSSTYSSSSTLYGVILGDGDATPEPTDYCLSGNIITDFTATTTLLTKQIGGKIIVMGTYNIANTGASSFTIKEIGLSRRNLYSGTTVRVLLTHDLLETPITIAPGDVGVVTYNLTFDFSGDQS